VLRPDDVFQFLRKRPFEPFRIYLSDGTTYEVRHPDLVMVAERYIVVGLPRSPETGPLIEGFETAALIHIVRLAPIGLSASA